MDALRSGNRGRTPPIGGGEPLQRPANTPASAPVTTPAVTDPTQRYTSAVGSAVSGRLTAPEQALLDGTLKNWMTASDADVGAAKGLLLRSFGIPPGVGIQLSASRGSAVTDMGTRQVTVGDLVLPDAKVPFVIDWNKREMQVNHEGLSTDMAPLTERDREGLRELTGMAEPARNRMYAASDSFDNWLSDNRYNVSELLSYGYHEGQVVAVARLKPTPENPAGEVAMFGAEPNGEHFWPMAKHSGAVAFDEVTGDFRYPADGKAWVKGRAGASASIDGQQLKPLPPFVMTA